MSIDVCHAMTLLMEGTLKVASRITIEKEQVMGEGRGGLLLESNIRPMRS